MFDQQLTMDGGAEDLAPKHEQPRLFTAPRTMRGQLELPRNPWLARMSDRDLRVALGRFGGPARESARDEARFRGWSV